MTTPKLSEPIFYTPAELRSDSSASDQVVSLAHDAFRRSKLPESHKWDLAGKRFPTLESYYAMLDDNSMAVLIFDESIQIGSSDSKAYGKVIGCAAAVPWKGGWAKEGAQTESGFEIKAVCVDGDEKYLRKGLAVKMMDSLTNWIVEKARSIPLDGNPDHDPSAQSEGTAKVTLWILAADCINGAYWRKRGYREVRRKTVGKGTWNCKTSFDMIVLQKDVVYELSI